MSQEKAQLIAPLGVMAAEGLVASGVVTATSFTANVIGSAKSIVDGANVVASAVTATSFVGNLTGNIKRLADSAPNINVGVTTATSFVGNLTGSVTDLTDAPAITVGMVTATTLEGPVTGNITGNVSGLAGGLGVNYNGGWTGAGTSQINAGVVTATTWYGGGSNLDGVSSAAVSQQSIGITSAATSIDLSNGNLIDATQSANTTVSFANTSNGNVYFIRTKDHTSTARTISWPASIIWSGGEAPTLISDSSSGDGQVFLLVTRDMGVTWYGSEVFNVDKMKPYSLWGWGKNQYGQIGQNDEVGHSSPVQIAGTDWSVVAAVSSAYCGASAIRSDGTLWSWGKGTYGLPGVGDKTNYSSPVQVGSGADWKTIQTGSYLKIATKSDGSLWTWGYNAEGGLGQNNREEYLEPEQVGTDTDWGKTQYTIGSGGVIVAASVKTDGTLWTWGSNQGGELGLNAPQPSHQSSPTQVGTDTTWSQVAMGNQTLQAVKTDGTFWTWGANQDGKLGQNNPLNTARSSPTQIGTDTTWSKVMLGGNASDNMAAIKTDNTLWIWGENKYGALGLNNEGNPTMVSSPTQLPGTTWKDITCGATGGVGGAFFLATKTDGTLWSWGPNEGDQPSGLGQNNTINYSSPTQIGTDTDWVYVNGGAGIGFALRDL